MHCVRRARVARGLSEVIVENRRRNGDSRSAYKPTSAVRVCFYCTTYSDKIDADTVQGFFPESRAHNTLL